MSLAFADRLLDQIEGSVILIGGDLVTNQMPDTFLDVELRMIRRQVLDFDMGMGVEELSNSTALMPGSPIDIEIDFGFVHSSAEVF